MKLIARISSRRDPDSGLRTVVEEAGDYETARARVYEAVAEGEQLLFLRIELEDRDVHS